MSHLGSAVARVEVIRAGDVVDSTSIWTLNPGTKVLQPFGVVLYDGSRKVLNKAKVLCA
jgi:hypothetical protein